jgi:hypothetical protein
MRNNLVIRFPYRLGPLSVRITLHWTAEGTGYQVACSVSPDLLGFGGRKVASLLSSALGATRHGASVVGRLSYGFIVPAM